jgi:glycosyltransferase involved in cell wall biosynthesis
MSLISVFIIAKNEADRIAKTIKSVQNIADEIVVIDSYSSDQTCEIAKSLGAKVLQNFWQGYGQQKIFGEQACKNKWILNLDADEELSPELATEIKNIFQQPLANNLAGFRIKIVNKFRFETKPKKLAYYYNQFRLYNVDLAGFNNSSVHDSVLLKMQNNNATILQLKNIVYHQSFRSFSHWLEKINSYSQMQAKDFVVKNKKPSIFKLLISPFLGFFKAFFIRRYFIYGLDGIIYSYIFAFSRFIKFAKIRELYKAKNNSES